MSTDHWRVSVAHVPRLEDAISDEDLQGWKGITQWLSAFLAAEDLELFVEHVGHLWETLATPACDRKAKWDAICQSYSAGRKGRFDWPTHIFMATGKIHGRGQLLVGLSIFKVRQQLARADVIVVGKRWRRKGLGTRLGQAGMEAAERAGPVTLVGYVDSSVEALSFFSQKMKAGFAFPPNRIRELVAGMSDQTKAREELQTMVARANQLADLGQFTDIIADESLTPLRQFEVWPNKTLVLFDYFMACQGVLDAKQ